MSVVRKKKVSNVKNCEKSSSAIKQNLPGKFCLFFVKNGPKGRLYCSVLIIP